MSISNVHAPLSQNESDLEFGEADFSPYEKWTNELETLLDRTFCSSPSETPVQNRTAIYSYGHLLDQNPQLYELAAQEQDPDIKSLFTEATEIVNETKKEYQKLYLTVKRLTQSLEFACKYEFNLLSLVTRDLNKIRFEEDLKDKDFVKRRSKAIKYSKCFKPALEEKLEELHHLQTTFTAHRSAYHSLLSRCKENNENLSANDDEVYRAFYAAYSRIWTLSCSYTSIALSKIGVLENAIVRGLKLIKVQGRIIRNNPIINR